MTLTLVESAPSVRASANQDAPEAARLRALHHLAVLDTPAEHVFDELTNAAAVICGVPIALLSLVDAERQWFKSNHGLHGLEETPRDVSFCTHTIGQDDVFEVPDTHHDSRFASNPLVTGGPEIGFYAGAPVVLPSGERVGSVCVMDRIPRELSPAQSRALQALARVAAAVLVERRRTIAATSALLQSDANAVHPVGRDVTEQNRDECAHAESEHRLRRLYESTPAILHTSDSQGRLLAVSDRWLEVLGYTREEVIGTPLLSYFTPESRRRAVEEVLPAFYANGHCDRLEYQIVRRDGRLVDITLSAVLERDASGHPLRTIVVLDDVTERKALAAEVARIHADLDAVVNSVPAMMGYWDGAGMNRYANRDYQAAVGIPLSRIVGRTMKEVYALVDPTAYAAIAPRLAKALAGERQEFELSLLSVTGLRQLHVTYVPRQTASGSSAGFFELAYDVTGRKTLELRLADSETRYRTLFDNLNVGFALCEIVVDREGRPIDFTFLTANKAIETVIGLVAADVVGRRVTKVIPGIESDSADWIGRFGRVALTGETTHFEQYSEALGRHYGVTAYRPAPGKFAVLSHHLTADADPR